MKPRKVKGLQRNWMMWGTEKIPATKASPTIIDNNESYRNDSKRFRDKFSGAKLIAAKSKGKAGIKKSKTNDEMFEFKIPNSGIRLIGKIAGKVTIDGKEYQLVNFNSVCNKNKASRQLRK